MTTIRGYDRRARKLSFWLFLSLSVLYGAVVASCADKPAGALPYFGFGAFCFVLLTRFWYVFWPTLCAGLCAWDLWHGLASGNWVTLAMSIFWLAMAIWTARSGWAQRDEVSELRG